MATDLQPMDDINLSVCAPAAAAHTRRRARCRKLHGGELGGGGGGDANVAGLDVGVFVTILVLALLLLCAVAGTVTYRRERRRRLREEQAYDLETGGGDAAYKAALARQRDVNECVATGMSLVNALLTVGSAVPFVGELAESANQLFGSAREFGDKADDVAMAARRVNEVLGMVHLVAKNVENLEDGKDLVAAKMERLVSLLTHSMRQCAGLAKGWLKRMWTVRTHVDSWASSIRRSWRRWMRSGRLPVREDRSSSNELKIRKTYFTTRCGTVRATGESRGSSDSTRGGPGGYPSRGYRRGRAAGGARF